MKSYPVNIKYNTVIKHSIFNKYFRVVTFIFTITLMVLSFRICIVAHFAGCKLGLQKAIDARIYFFLISHSAVFYFLVA